MRIAELFLPYRIRAEILRLRIISAKKCGYADFKGKVVLLFFGFTFCPDICPTGLIELDATLEELGDRKKEVQVLFISVDPERDTPEALKEFVTYFNSTFIGLTGTPQEIRIVAEQYGVKFEKVSVEGGGDYLVRHSANTFVIDPEGDHVDTIPHNTPPEEMARIVGSHIGK